MKTLKINGRPDKQYKIAQNGVSITTFTNSKLPTEELIPFENIKSDRLFYTQKFPMLLILSGISIIIFVMIIVDSFKQNTSYPFINNITWPTLSLLLIGAYIYLQPKVYFIKTFTGKYIKFKVKENESEISEFVNKIIEKRNEYLRLKYGIPSQYLSYDAQYSNFNIMIKESIITAQEYQEKIEELNRLFNQTTPAKTFLGYSQN